MNYTLAELKKTDPKDWYVYYSYRNPETGFLKPFKVRNDINRIKDLKERRAYGVDLVAKTNKLLRAGWSPFVTVEKTVNPLGKLTLTEAMDEMLKIKLSELRGRSNTTYKSVKKIFATFLEENGLSKIMPKNFTPLHAQMFSDYMVNAGYSPKTHNNKLAIVKALFNLIKKRKLIDSKPFEDIGRKKVGEGRITFYDDKQKQKIKQHLIDTDNKLYLYVQFVFYCFVRPKELMLIQVKHLNFKDKTILVPGSAAKNHKNRVVPIHPALFKLAEKKYKHLDPELYLFGRGLEPHPVTVDRNRASEAHRKMLESIGVDTKHKLYEWKHTGARLFILSGKNPYDLMVYMGHASLDETMGYLRSLGVSISNHKTDPNAWTF